MTNEITQNAHSSNTVELHTEYREEEFESTGDYHRMAAQHFADAAKHHLLAAAADDDGDNEVNAQHAYLAYRHQLNAVQCAEIAAMGNGNLEDEHDDEVDRS